MRKSSRKIHIIDNALIVVFALLMLIAATSLTCNKVYAASNDVVNVPNTDCEITITKTDMFEATVKGERVLFYDFWIPGYVDESYVYRPYTLSNNGATDVKISRQWYYWEDKTRATLITETDWSYNVSAGKSYGGNFYSFPREIYDGNSWVNDETCLGYYLFVTAPLDASDVNLTFSFHTSEGYHGYNSETGLYEYGECCTKCNKKENVVPIYEWDNPLGNHVLAEEDFKIVYEDQGAYYFAMTPAEDLIFEFNKSDGFISTGASILLDYDVNMTGDEISEQFWWNADQIGYDYNGNDSRTNIEYEFSAGITYLVALGWDMRSGEFGEAININVTKPPEKFTSQDGLWQYYIKNDQAYLCKWLGTGDTITYPRTIDGYTVRQVRSKGTYTEEQMNAIKHVIFEMGTIETAENDDYLEPADPSYYRSTHFDNFPYDYIEDVTLHSQGYIDSHDGSYYNINYYDSDRIICACDYDILQETQPTCSERGHVKKVCKTCGDVYDKDTDWPTYVHDYSIPLMPVYECTEDRVPFKCATCDEVSLEYVYGDGNHTWVPTVSISPCSANYYPHKCELCGKKQSIYVDQTVDHKYTVLIEDVPSNCQQKGYKVYKCETCDYTSTEWDNDYVPTGEHDYQIEKHVAATCTYGYDLYKCTVCGDQFQNYNWNEEPTENHTYELVEEKPVTSCAEPGWKRYECEVCGDSYQDNYTYMDHQYEPYEDDVRWVSCEDSERIRYICKCCGDTKYDYYSKKHDYIIVSTKVAPTCTETGLGKGVCRNCQRIDDNAVFPTLSPDGKHHFTLKHASYGERLGCDYCAMSKAVFLDVNNDETTFLKINDYRDAINNGYVEGDTRVYLRNTPKYDTQVIVARKNGSDKELQMGRYFSEPDDMDLFADFDSFNKNHIAKAQVTPSTIKKGETYYTWLQDWKGDYSYRTHHEHDTNPETFVNVDTTCKAQGYRDWDCIHCGKHFHEYKEPTSAKEHKWGDWTVTKPATTSAEGKEERICKVCAVKETRSIPKLKSTSTQSPGSSAGTNGTVVAVKPAKENPAATRTNITTKVKTVVKTPNFSSLRLLSKTQTNNSIKLEWSKQSGATRYVIYGGLCGNGDKQVKIATVKGTSYNVKKINKKALQKGKYYNFKVVAEKNGKVIGISKTIHVSTSGNTKNANHSGVTVSDSVVKKAQNIKKGKTLSLGAKTTVKKGYKVKNHSALRYESTNTKIATVNSSGKIKGVAKGTCYVYVYAQNGLYKKIKVTVK